MDENEHNYISSCVHTLQHSHFDFKNVCKLDSFNHSDLLPLHYSISLVPRQHQEVNIAHD